MCQVTEYNQICPGCRKFINVRISTRKLCEWQKAVNEGVEGAEEGRDEYCPVARTGLPTFVEGGTEYSKHACDDCQLQTEQQKQEAERQRQAAEAAERRREHAERRRELAESDRWGRGPVPDEYPWENEPPAPGLRGPPPPGFGPPW